MLQREFANTEKVNKIIKKELIKREKRRSMLSDYTSVNKVLKPEEELLGNDYLESASLSNYEKSFILTQLIVNDFSKNLKPINECTEEELKEYFSSFPMLSTDGEDNLKFFNPEYNKKHLLFLNESYHNYLNLDNYNTTFVPKKLNKAYTYLVLGAGPVGLVFAINALLRGHKVILIDNRVADARNRYIGIFPKFIINLVDYGFAPSCFLKWIVLDVTNDKTPKRRRQTNRLFLHIQALVRLLSLTAIKLGGKIYRNYEYDIKHGVLTDKNTDKKISYTDFDEIVVAVGCGKNDDLKKKLKLNFNVESKTPWDIAAAAMKKIGDTHRAIKLFKRKPIMISRYVMWANFELAKENLNKMINNAESQDYINNLFNFQNFFILLDPPTWDKLYNTNVGRQLSLPPNWHATGLKKIIKLEKNYVASDFFHVLVIGPMFTDFAKSCLKNENKAIKAIAMHVLLNEKKYKKSASDESKKDILQAIKSKDSLIFGSRFSVFLSTENVHSCINQHGKLVNLRKWKPVSIGSCKIGKNKEIKKYFLVGDILSSPWYKFSQGLGDAFNHIESYFKPGRKDYNIARSEYNLTIRQLHIVNSLMIVRKELEEYFPKDFSDLTV